jgi:membrane associated rhomboid family serine protease
MIQNMFANMPPVVKNILLLNVVMYIIALLGEAQGIPVTRLLGGYVFNSPYFEPYQMVTHFFMHSTQTFFHIFFNMFAFVVFGSMLERVWGPKRFFIFYVATAIGAFIFHQLFGYWEVKSVEAELLAQGFNEYKLREIVQEAISKNLATDNALLNQYILGLGTPVVGASGAVYGVLVAFGYLFPNTQLMLLFPPIPVKAKWLVIFLVGVAIYNSFISNPGDNVAHLAHLGGAIVGFILVLYWQKSTRNFY